MSPLRALNLQFRGFALRALVLALMMKLAMPTGYMPDTGSATLSVRICSGSMDRAVLRDTALPLKRPAPSPDGKPSGADAVCPYAALAMAGIGSAAPELMAIALAFILLLGLAPARIGVVRRFAHLRPPLRGPPART